MLRTIVTAAILVLGITAAQAETVTSSVEVRYDDLNLAHAEDGKILADRLQAAARSVCLDILDNSRNAPGELQVCETAATRRAITYIEGHEVDNVLVHLSAR